MNDYVYLYNMIKFVDAYSLIEKLVGECLKSGRYMDRLNEIVKFELGIDYRTYADKLMECMKWEEEAGCKLLEAVDIMVTSDTKELENTNVEDWMDLKQANMQKLLKGRVCIEERQYHLLNEEIAKYKKQERALMQQEARVKSHIEKMNVTTRLQEDMHRENSVLHKENQALTLQIKQLKGRLKIKNKRVLYLSAMNLIQEDDAIRSEYELASFRIESSLKLSPMLDQLISGADYIIFESEHAKHSLFMKIKDKNKLLLTKHTNLQKVFTDITIQLGEQ